MCGDSYQISGTLHLELSVLEEETTTKHQQQDDEQFRSRKEETCRVGVVGVGVWGGSKP